MNLSYLRDRLFAVRNYPIIFVPITLALAAVCVGCQPARLTPPVDGELAADENFVVDETEIVVVTTSPIEARSLMRSAGALGYVVLKTDTLDELQLTMLTLRIPENQRGAAAIRELESLEPGVTAGVNHGYVPQGETTQQPREYAKPLMKWPRSGCSPKVPIGVLDARLVGAVKGSVTSTDFSRGTGNEKSQHGMQVVSLLKSSGMLKNPKIFHADIVSPNTKLGDAASVDTLLRGLNWVIGKKVHLVNISLAGPYNKILDRAMSNAARAGVTIVAPAGNEGPRQSVRYPAAFRTTIAVTAIDAEHRIYRRSARGKQIDISAPGVDLGIRIANRTSYVSGTSFAAPMVTASIAADPRSAAGMNIATVRKRLAAGAYDLGVSGHDPVFGHGLIQAPSGCAG
jgi:subtilisin family serine protease